MWGAFATSSIDGFLGGSLVAPFNGAAIPVSAWSSSLSLMGMQLPNWLPVVAAVAAVVVVYARWRGAQLSPTLPKLLLIYAIVHVALFGFMIWENGRGSIGVGIFVMLVALFGLRRETLKIDDYSRKAAE